MKTTVPMIAGAVAAMTLTVSSCSDNHEPLTPTGPSAISEAAERPATSRTTGYPAAGVQANDEIAGTGDNWQNTGLNRSYTYIEGVPGTPQHVRVRPTGGTREVDGQTEYELELTWRPPNWGATDAHEVEMVVRRGQTIVVSPWAVSKRPTIEPPLTTFLPAAEGRFYMSLCNEVGCGPPWDAGSIVIGDAMEKPGPPEMTIERGRGSGTDLINGRVFEAPVYELDLNWRNTDFARDVQFEYWVRQARRRTTTKSTKSVQGNTHQESVTLMEGSWTVTARLRNSQGWGRRAVLRLDVQVDDGTTRPGGVRLADWSNGRLTWDSVLVVGGLPILKYEYFYAAECPAGTGTPYPLKGNNRYYLEKQNLRIALSPAPEEMSIQVYNRKGAGNCVTAS